jgi:hypothetical protein
VNVLVHALISGQTSFSDGAARMHRLSKDFYKRFDLAVGEQPQRRQ